MFNYISERMSILNYSGQTDKLSHFYTCELKFRGVKYFSAEQLYQHEKAVFFKDYEKAKSMLIEKNNCRKSTFFSRLQLSKSLRISQFKLSELAKPFYPTINGMVSNTMLCFPLIK